MAISLSQSIDSVDWTCLEDLFMRALLGKRSAASLEQTFRNSQVALFAYDENRLIGAGRALTDKINWTVVFDVAVDPECQGKGLGKAIVEALASISGARNVMLQSVPGKENFYARLGYRPMTSAMAKYENPDWASTNGYIAPAASSGT
jgi:predicted N-acetyltransferase YhbS